MARGIHPTCSIKMITEDLLEKGFKIINVTNIMKKMKTENGIITKPLSLHMLVFDKLEDVKDIHKISIIAGLKAKIEPLRKKTTLMPQSKKCQAYGHTQSFCHKEARCVKCAGRHATKDCKLVKLEKAKCANCGEAHPANYRGCVVAKELQKRREKTLQENKRNNLKTTNAQEMTSIQKTQQNFPTLSEASLSVQNSSASTSYVQVAKGKIQQAKKEQTHLDAINKTLQAILGKLENQEDSIKSILTRVTKLENGNRGAPITKK